MEILIRNWDNTSYVWKAATWKNGEYYIEDDCGFEYGIKQTNILAVRDDNRIGYVQCNYCNELIENTPESIERHYAESEAKKDCLKCEYLRAGNKRKDKTTTYTPNGDGTYRIVESYVSNLICNQSYWPMDIESNDAKRNCQYVQCRRHGVQQIDDIFVRYPEPFVRQITVDVLDAKKYPFEAYNNGFFEYDLKSRDTLKACVNELGIIDHFVYISRGWRYYLYYSDKYEKLFYLDGSKYSERMHAIMTETKINSTLKKISALYKEANGNDEE